MKARIAGAGAALAMLMVTGAVVVPAATAAPAHPAARPGCAVRWGSLPKHSGQMVRSKITAVRAGRHACFDRLVIDVSGPKPVGYQVRYVAQIVQDGSGAVIPVRGGAKLQITALGPAVVAFPANSRHLANVSGFATFRQVVGAGSFEGVTTIGLGVRAKLPFRIFTIADDQRHTRLVIDVAHTWLPH